MLNTNISVKGSLKILVYGSDGLIKDKREFNNLVVSTGLGFIASRMKDTTDDVMSYMAIGTGTTASAAGDTSLQTELDRKSLISTSVSSNVITYFASWNAGEGTGAITEAGIFNAASGGTMLARTVFDVVNKSEDESLAVLWSITISAG